MTDRFRALARSLLVVAWSAFALTSTAAFADDLAARLDEAETLATREKTDAAIDAYLALLSEAGGSADVHYNLGTLYLEAGDLGRGALHLRAALRRDPKHDDAKYNLEVAEAARTDQLVGVGPGLSVDERVGRSVSPGLARALALFPWVLLMAVLGAWPWLEVRGRRLRVVLLFASLAGLLGGMFVLRARLGIERETQAVVLDKETEARKGPTDDAASAFTAHAGLAGVVKEEQGDFLRLRFENGLEAWIATRAVGIVP